MADKKKTSKPVGERSRIFVPIFKDEYAPLGVTNDMGLTQARTLVRLAAGVAVPLRATEGGSVSSLARAIKDAPAEKRDAIMALLSGKTAE